MRPALALLLAAIAVSALPDGTALAQVQDQFVDDPDNPTFWHGEALWAIVMVIGSMAAAIVTRNGLATAGVAVLVMMVAVVRGDWGGMTLLLMLLLGLSGVALWQAQRS